MCVDACLLGYFGFLLIRCFLVSRDVTGRRAPCRGGGDAPAIARSQLRVRAAAKPDRRQYRRLQTWYFLVVNDVKETAQPSNSI